MKKNGQLTTAVLASGAGDSDVVQIVGRKCWKATFAYGGELCLHFGRQLSYESPLMKGKKRGEWQLRTRGTAWQVLTPNQGFSSKDGNESALLKKLKCLVGRKVKDISVSNANVLTIELEGNRLFRVTPTRHDARSKLPFWELAMPQHKVASFRPTIGWSLKPSNVAKTEENETHANPA
jgi:hypothetical protein